MAHLIACASFLSWWCFFFFLFPLLTPPPFSSSLFPSSPGGSRSAFPARLSPGAAAGPVPHRSLWSAAEKSRPNPAPAPSACRSAPTPPLVPLENEKYPRTLGRGCAPRNGDARTWEGDVRMEISPHAPGEGMCGKRENFTWVQFLPLVNLRAVYPRPSPRGEAAPTRLSPLCGCVGTARSGRGRALGAGAGFDI